MHILFIWRIKDTQSMENSVPLYRMIISLISSQCEWLFYKYSWWQLLVYRCSNRGLNCIKKSNVKSNEWKAEQKKEISWEYINSIYNAATSEAAHGGDPMAWHVRLRFVYIGISYNFTIPFTAQSSIQSTTGCFQSRLRLLTVGKH